MQKKPVLAIGLDAADANLVERWMAQGHMPHLQKLCSQGGYGRLDNLDCYKAETPWTTFLTGCMPETTGYWTPLKFREGSYSVDTVEAYDYGRRSPFYALGKNYRVAVFDIPQVALSDEVNGRQVLGWGAHSPQTPSHSQPAELFAEVTEKFGPHPSLHQDHGEWWNEAYQRFLLDASKTGISRRTQICTDWMKDESWDLLFTIFGETHSAGHDFWHLSQQDHPLFGHGGTFAADPLLDVYRAVDEAVGKLTAAAPGNAHIVVFAVHGSGNNITDVPSMLFLPELLYRYSFPGRVQMAPGKLGTPVPPMELNPGSGEWQHKIWDRRHEINPIKRWTRRGLPRRWHKHLDQVIGNHPLDIMSIKDAQATGAEPSWQPAMWYSKLWPQMRAFAIPSFSEGYIRINLAGREPSGVVAPQDYSATCDELANLMMQLTNPRTGKPAVEKVVKTRADVGEMDPDKPEADLVVAWADEPADVVDHPSLGRIGPVPFRRTGSHRSRGFWAVNGPRVQYGDPLPHGHAVDLAPTILDLMGAPLPNEMDGRSLLSGQRRAKIA